MSEPWQENEDRKSQHFSMLPVYNRGSLPVVHLDSQMAKYNCRHIEVLPDFFFFLVYNWFLNTFSIFSFVNVCHLLALNVNTQVFANRVSYSTVAIKKSCYVGRWCSECSFTSLIRVVIECRTLPCRIKARCLHSQIHLTPNLICWL